MSEPIKLEKAQTRDLWREDLEGYELVEEGDWDVDCKWQHISNIVVEVATGKYYEYTVSRSGSPFTDWYYSFEDYGTELHEVEKVTKTIVRESWERV